LLRGYALLGSLNDHNSVVLGVGTPEATPDKIGLDMGSSPFTP
jgi:hypothetical protein